MVELNFAKASMINAAQPRPLWNGHVCKLPSGEFPYHPRLTAHAAVASMMSTANLVRSFAVSAHSWAQLGGFGAVNTGLAVDVGNTAAATPLAAAGLGCAKVCDGKRVTESPRKANWRMVINGVPA